MQNTATPVQTVTSSREPRPFLYLTPKTPSPARITIDAPGLRRLEQAVADQVPMLVRGLVHHTMVLQQRRGLGHAPNGALPISVLNRRRRSARAWVQAVVGGRTDQATLHALCHTWAPQLAGTGPELRHCLRTAKSCVELLRGGITALVFGEARDNLVADARALHALETVLAVHLGAIQDAARAAFVGV